MNSDIDNYYLIHCLKNNVKLKVYVFCNNKNNLSYENWENEKPGFLINFNKITRIKDMISKYKTHLDTRNWDLISR